MEANGDSVEAKWLRSPSTKSETTNSRSEPSWLTPPSKNSEIYSPTSAKSSNRRRLKVIQQDDEEGSCCGYCPSDPVLYWFKIFHLFSGLMGLASLTANAYVLTDPTLDFIHFILHVYTIFMCVVVTLVETDWKYFISTVRFLESWICRGIFYSFVGFMTMSQEGVTFTSLAATPVTVVSLIQICVGVMYLLMGITCVQGFRDRRSLSRASPQQYVEIPDGASPVFTVNKRETV